VSGRRLKALDPHGPAAAILSDVLRIVAPHVAAVPPYNRLNLLTVADVAASLVMEGSGQTHPQSQPSRNPSVSRHLGEKLSI
jgi:hypothetical protein